MVAQFDLASSRTAAHFSRRRDLPERKFVGDPSLRLKNGAARDDAAASKNIQN